MRPEDGAPPESHQQLTADEGSEYRRESHHQHEHGKHPDRVALIEMVADDGAWDHERRASTERLKESKDNQRLDVDGRCTTHRRQDEERQPEIQRRLAPESIRQRAIDRLAERDPHEVDAETHLHQRSGRAQLPGDGRQCWQIRVDCERAHGRQATEHERELEVCRPAGRRNHQLRDAARVSRVFATSCTTISLAMPSHARGGGSRRRL